MNIIPRAEWGARHEAGDGPAPLPAREMWLHHSVTIAPDLVPPFGDEHQAMRTLELIGEQRFHRGISYTFAVMPNGRVYEGHGVDRLGAHTGGRNSFARAIVWVGNYDVSRPPAAMVEATAQLLVHGWRKGWWTAPRLNGGHRQAPGASTTCPGRHAMDAIGQINARAAAIRDGAPIPSEEDDSMSAADVQALKDFLQNITGGDLRYLVALQKEAMAREAIQTATIGKLVEVIAADESNPFTLEDLRTVIREEGDAALRRIVQVEVSIRDDAQAPA